MFLCILFEPKTNHRFEITSFFFFPCYVQYTIDYSHGHMNFSHHHFLISYSPATFNMFHVTREVTLSARKSIPSKNNFRGITIGIGPIWGITSYLHPLLTPYNVLLTLFGSFFFVCVCIINRMQNSLSSCKLLVLLTV